MYVSNELRQRYRQIRAVTEKICQPLTIDDYQIQATSEISPPKWHIAHVTWFFETFLLIPHDKNYQAFHPRYQYLFNSYYETIGDFHPRLQRGLLSRPTVEEVYAYRHAVDVAMEGFFDYLDKSPDQQILLLIDIGLNHEQQHQELLCMDIKYNLSVNPLKPSYREDLQLSDTNHTRPIVWHEQAAGLYDIGHTEHGFAYDNESPRHPTYLTNFKLANRLISNGEYLTFIEDKAYQRVDLWLSDGWSHIKQHQWKHPLYWLKEGEEWLEMTLSGLQPLNLHAPVCHISYYEAEAYARWTGKRLATEAEQEVVLAKKPLEGNFFDQDYLHPMPANDASQWFGDLWAWTSTAYYPYPNFIPFTGSAGEYNGKFMCNQMVLRGGSCVTSHSHMRATYRNFFYPHERWAFTGIRLADNF